jgi:hypothetical protein
MPLQNGVWRDERRHLSQSAASESLSEHRETTALVIVETQRPVTQLRLQRAVLFVEIALLAFEPSKQPANSICSGITRRVQATAQPAHCSDRTRLRTGAATASAP